MLSLCMYISVYAIFCAIDKMGCLPFVLFSAGTAAKAAASESGKDATKTFKHNAYTGMSIEVW